ncbi:hypothetical protein SASPL_100337 [Salvia splendens]|uniref:Uncharacterized protein n=1 Tax=Salvia splendens TaxID=180675 RepID=A0A8X9ABH5_SALSN|nr:hypothetical protein SASPL_100337 [Salvia splendens]
MEGLTEDEKKALRGSKFAPLPPGTNQARPQSRLAHPGGPMKTNKAAALAKFLERKLQEPNGLASVDPKLVELAVRNAKKTVQCSGASTSGRIVHHVNKFDDAEVHLLDALTFTKAQILLTSAEIGRFHC